MTMTPTPVQTAPEQVPSPNPAVNNSLRICPQCGSDNVRESSTRRGMDLMPSNLGKEAFRCRSCRGRFYVKIDSQAPVSPAARKRRADRKREPIWKHPKLRRHMNEISIALGSLVAFGIFLYLLARSGISF